MNKQIRKKCDLCMANQSYFRLLYQLNDFNIVQCQKCGLVFRDIILDSQETDCLYSENYFTKEQKEFFFEHDNIKRKDFLKRIKAIENIYGQKGKILDVGCAIGTFLDVCQKRGWEVYGEELSDFAAQYAKDKFDLNVFSGELIEAKFPDNFFDVVTLWDVVDHSERPRLLLKEVHRILKKDGLIVVQTTMKDGLIYRTAHYLYLLSRGLIKFPVEKGHPIHHSTFYSTKTLNQALELAGFKVIKKKKTELAGQLTSVAQNSLFRVFYGLVNLIGYLINKPLERAFYGTKNKS